MRKAIFIDRDGVINENVGDLVKPEQLKFLPGASEAIKNINASEYLAIIITNQPHIAKGFCTFEDMDKIHARMKDLLHERGARVDAIYVCPHHPKKGFEGEVPELKIACDCRKPKPGLILQAIKEHNIDPAKSWMIGDSKSDVVAGQGAGVKTIFVITGGGSGATHEDSLQDVKPDFVKKDLGEAVELILKI